MDFMDALREVGSFGPFQLILLFAAAPSVMLFGSFSYWIQILILLVPNHRCRLSDANGTQLLVGQCGLQRSMADDALASLQEAPGSESGFLMSMITMMSSAPSSPSNNDTDWTHCPDGWVYDLTDLHPTVVVEFDWVCSKSWKTFACHSIYWAGSMVGYFASGIAVDRFGRWRTVLCLTISLMVGFLASLVPINFATFSVARFFAGMASMPLQTVTYTLIMEYIEPCNRKLTAVLCVFFWLVGAAIFPWVAYLCQDWRLMIGTGLLPAFPLLFLIIKYVPESASWQLVQGDVEGAIETLKRIGQTNGKTLSEERANKLALAFTESNRLQTSKTQCSIVDLVRTPNMRKKTVCVFVSWMLVCLCYHGNNLNQSNLSTSVYLIYSLGALLEMPATLVHLLIVDRLGRRPPIVIALLCVGLMGQLLTFLPPASPWASFFLGLLLRSFLSLSYNVLHQLGVELFPTCLRGRGICLMRTCGDLANTVGPFLVSMASVQPMLPQLIFSLLAVVAIVLILFLPETLNQNLPQTIEDAEAFGLDQGICFCPALHKTLPNDKCDIPTTTDGAVKGSHTITITTTNCRC